MAPKSRVVEAPARSRNYKAPGRLGDPQRELSQEPRATARLINALKQYGIDRNRPPPPLAQLDSESTMEELGLSMAEVEAGWEKMYDALPNDLPGDTIELETEQSQEAILGPDGNTITLVIHRPVLKGGPLPCIVYMHSGAMTMLKTTNKIHSRWCKSLAAMGMVVVAVDFRNVWSQAGFDPFPAGLNDCCTAVKWVHAHKDHLNIRNVVLHGHGGGGNLALATVLKGNREGWSCRVDGVYASAPIISNGYHWSDERKLSELPSLIECDGYIVNVDFQKYVARVYTPQSENMTNPLAWPYYAPIRDLEGLPPHVLSMDELDPFRDEGMAYFRKLSAAGVSCSGQVNLGHAHGTSLVFRQALPNYNRTAVRHVAHFAKFT